MVNSRSNSTVADRRESEDQSRNAIRATPAEPHGDTLRHVVRRAFRVATLAVSSAAVLVGCSSLSPDEAAAGEVALAFSAAYGNGAGGEAVP